MGKKMREGLESVTHLLVQGKEYKALHRREEMQPQRSNKNVFMSSSILNSGFWPDISQPAG